MKEMIWEKDVVVTLVDGYKVEHLVFTYGDEKSSKEDEENENS